MPAASARMSLRLSAICRRSLTYSSRLPRLAAYRIAVPCRAVRSRWFGVDMAQSIECIFDCAMDEAKDLRRHCDLRSAFEIRASRMADRMGAIDRMEHPDALPSDIATRNQNQDDVPVVSCDLFGASAEEFMRPAFSRIPARFVDTIPPRPRPGPYQTESTNDIEA